MTPSQMKKTGDRMRKHTFKSFINKGLKSRIYKEQLQFNNKRQVN